jgi:hypothetical protein
MLANAAFQQPARTLDEESRVSYAVHAASLVTETAYDILFSDVRVTFSSVSSRIFGRFPE